MQGVQAIVCLVSLFLSGCQLKPLAAKEGLSSASNKQLVQQVELFHRFKFCFKTFIDRLAVVTSNHPTSYSYQKVINALYGHFELCVWKVLQQNIIAKGTINKETKLSIKQPIVNQEHLYKQRFTVSTFAEPESMKPQNMEFVDASKMSRLAFALDPQKQNEDDFSLSAQSFGTSSPQSHESFEAIDQRFGRDVDSFPKRSDDLTDSSQSFGERNPQSHDNFDTINQRFGRDVESFQKSGEDLSDPSQRLGKRRLLTNENYARTTQRFGRNLGKKRREDETASFSWRFGKRGVQENVFLESSKPRFGKNENQMHSEYPSHPKFGKRDPLNNLKKSDEQFKKYEQFKKSDVNFDQRFGRDLKGFQKQNEGDLSNSLQSFGKRDLEARQTFEEESQRSGRNWQGFQKRDAEDLYNVLQRFGKRGVAISREFSSK